MKAKQTAMSTEDKDTAGIRSRRKRRQRPHSLNLDGPARAVDPRDSPGDHSVIKLSPRALEYLRKLAEDSSLTPEAALTQAMKLYRMALDARRDRLQANSSQSA